MFIVIYDVDCFMTPRGALDEATTFKTLDEAIEFAVKDAAEYERDVEDYTIFVPHPVKVTYSI